MASTPVLPPFVSPLGQEDPAVVGGCRLIGRLGSGGMGTVYAAVSDHGERVAVKIAHPALRDAARFEREVDLMRSVEGVCGVGVHATGAYQGRPWAAIEYVPGLDLNRHVRESGPLTGEPLVLVAAGCAEALTAIHGAGIAHGDIKPGNVLMAPGGPKVVDYGIARRVDTAPPAGTAGSLGWMAPERYTGAAPDRSSDVFAWACLVVFAATGRPPFGRPPTGTDRRTAVLEMAHRARTGDVELDALPEGLRPLLRRALSSDPAGRPWAEEAYLECLLLLGPEDGRPWAERLRGLLGRYWPRIDTGWDRPERWLGAAVTLAATASAAPWSDAGVSGTAGSAPASPRGPEQDGEGEPAASADASGSVAESAPSTASDSAGTAASQQTGPPVPAKDPSVPAAPSGTGAAVRSGGSTAGKAGTLGPVQFTALVCVFLLITVIVAGGGSHYLNSLIRPTAEVAAPSEPASPDQAEPTSTPTGPAADPNNPPTPAEPEPEPAPEPEPDPEPAVEPRPTGMDLAEEAQETFLAADSFEVLIVQHGTHTLEPYQELPEATGSGFPTFVSRVRYEEGVMAWLDQQLAPTGETWSSEVVKDDGQTAMRAGEAYEQEPWVETGPTTEGFVDVLFPETPIDAWRVAVEHGSVDDEREEAFTQSAPPSASDGSVAGGAFVSEPAVLLTGGLYGNEEEFVLVTGEDGTPISLSWSGLFEVTDASARMPVPTTSSMGSAHYMNPDTMELPSHWHAEYTFVSLDESVGIEAPDPSEVFPE